MEPRPLLLADLEAIENLHSGRKHIISLLVENRPGVLARITGLFSRRGFNIQTLSAGPSEIPEHTRIILTLDGALHPINQVTQQLHKLVNVIEINDLDPSGSVAREIALFKLRVTKAERDSIIAVVEVFRGQVIDISEHTMMIEITGADTKLNAFERIAREHGLIEMVRTGEIALSRDESGVSTPLPINVGKETNPHRELG